MKLNLDRVTETPEEHRFEASPDWWREWCRANDEPGEPEADAFVFTLRAHRMGDDVYLEGDLTGTCDIECSRCLRRYCHALRDAFQLVLEPVRDRTPQDPEGAESLGKYGLYLGEDLEAGWYRGKEVVLDAVFAEKVSLSMPIQPLCADDCAGLCPGCGRDRRTSDCDCAERKRDLENELKPKSPFAVLAALRGGTEGNS